MHLEKMTQEANPPYQFKLFGSAYAYPSQSTYYRMMTVAFSVSISGLILLGLLGPYEYVGWFILLAGSVIGLFVLETGYRRGRALG